MYCGVSNDVTMYRLQLHVTVIIHVVNRKVQSVDTEQAA